MAIEWDSHKSGREEVVEHFHSPVAEMISFLTTLENPQRHKQLSLIHSQFLNEMNSDSKEFLKYWETRTDWSFTFLFNFFLPCPYFHEVEIFLQKVSRLPDHEFLYHFFGESIPHEQLKEFIGDPEKIMAAEETIWWENAEKRTHMMELLTSLPAFRERFHAFLQNVLHTDIFKKEIEQKSSLVEDTMGKVKSMVMEPLALAQYIMGKTFRRTSLYQMYYFIPSYFFSAFRMRIFDTKTCIVIYGVNAPFTDSREKSAEFEVQLKALSDRNRILILRMLSGKREYGAKIAEYLGITTATVSHHLELLKKAGFVKEEKIGTIKYFSYEQEHTEAVLKQLQEFIKPKQ